MNYHITFTYRFSHLHYASRCGILRRDPNNRKIRRTSVVPKKSRTAGRTRTGETDRSRKIRRVEIEKKRERERGREREKKRNQPRDTSPQKTRRATREEERLSGTPKSGMGAWVEWGDGGDGRETRRPARNSDRWWGQFRAAGREVMAR